MPRQRRTSAPDPLAELLAQYPPRLTREQAAKAISRHFFPIKKRTLERWPLPVTILNGKACLSAAEVFAEAQRRVDAAPPIAA